MVIKVKVLKRKKLKECVQILHICIIFISLFGGSVVMSSGGMFVKMGGQLVRAVSLLQAYGMALKLSGAVGTTFVCWAISLVLLLYQIFNLNVLCIIYFYCILFPPPNLPRFLTSLSSQFYSFSLSKENKDQSKLKQNNKAKVSKQKIRIHTQK